ncbi:MAG: peptide ABC transporter substrate-binding protein [Chloroflexota bacterium]|nr:peptide ABC transporter substrate-binding protein [Chloroflexota bacterium]
MTGSCWRRPAAIAMALVLGACAPATGPAQPAAGGAPVRGGTLIFALWQEPTTLAPLYINQTVGTVVGNVVNEGLIMTEADGSYAPKLAKSLPTLENGGVKLSPDGKKMSVTYELLPELKWSDGKAVTSADVKFTWEAWMRDAKVVNRAGFSDIESVDTPSEVTAVVNYRTIYAAYPLNFASVLPKHMLENEVDISRTAYNRMPIGTGPFRITEFKSGDSITAERNENYRVKDRPYLDRVIFKSVPDSKVAIAQLKAGEVQGMWNLLESETQDVENDPNIKVFADPGPSVERIELNTARNQDQTDPNSVHPVLGELAVRRALLHATPIPQIIDKILFNKVRPASSPVSQGWASPKELKQDGYDPNKANDELDRAGWTKGPDGVRAKNSVRAALTITTTTGNQARERIEQVLIDAYKAVGVELKIQNQPSSVLLSGSWASGDPRKRGSFDLVMYASSPGIDPHTVASQRYHSKNIPSAANGGIGQNYTRFKDAEADKAIDEAGATLDQQKRRDAYARALTRLNDAVAIIWMYERADIDAHRADVFGWKNNPWQEVTSNIEDWFLKK